jgi:hypothetical protein
MFFKRLKRKNTKKTENYITSDGKDAGKSGKKRVLNL